MASISTHPLGRRRARIAAALLALLILGATFAQGGVPDAEARFDTAWRLVEQRYWNLDARAVDWNEARERYLPQALDADDEAAFYAVIEAMYEELADDHSVFVPPARVEEIRREFGDLPCLGVFSQSPGSERDGIVRYELLDDGVGYLAVPVLAGTDVAGAVRRAVGRLEQQGATALVLDLRGNPGGRLITMMQVAGVFTRGLLWRALTNWTLPVPYPALGSPATELPLVVLVDGDVNSAAEGLSGALQQQGRATVIGERTAGNVEAVLPFCLRDGSQAWIATGVLAPFGAPTWEGRGVEPDVTVASADALDAALEYFAKQP